MWTILSIIAVICLVIFWQGKNAVWGAMTGGVFIGFIVTIISYFLGNGFHWSTVGKGLVIGTILGSATEVVWKIANRGKTQPAD